MFVKLKCKSNDQTKLQNNCIILTSRLINIKTSSFLHYFRRQHLKSTEIVISTSISISTNKKTATTWSTSSTAEGIVSQPLSSYLRWKKQQQDQKHRQQQRELYHKHYHHTSFFSQSARVTSFKSQQYQTHGEWVSEWPGKPTIGPGFDEKAKLEKRCPLIGTSHGLKDDVRMSDTMRTSM